MSLGRADVVFTDTVRNYGVWPGRVSGLAGPVFTLLGQAGPAFRPDPYILAVAGDAADLHVRVIHSLIITTT